MPVWVAAILAGLVGVATLVLLWKLFFRDLDDFQDCLDAFTTDRVGGVLNDFGETFWPTLRLCAWIACGGIVGLGVYLGLDRLFG